MYYLDKYFFYSLDEKNLILVHIFLYITPTLLLKFEHLDASQLQKWGNMLHATCTMVYQQCKVTDILDIKHHKSLITSQ